MRIRSIYFLSFIFILALLLFSVYLQIFQGMVPCPLCTLQRLTFAILAILFLIGLFVSQHLIFRSIINFLALLASGLGIFLAGRQIWLQHFPSSAGNECGVSLQYMLQVLPFNEAMGRILTGSAECAQRGFELLNLNMAEWALIWFGLFFFLTLYLFFASKSR